MDCLFELKQLYTVGQVADIIQLAPATVRKTLNRLEVRPVRETGPKLYSGDSLSVLFVEDSAKIRRTQELRRRNAAIASEAARLKRANEKLGTTVPSFGSQAVATKINRVVSTRSHHGIEA